MLKLEIKLDDSKIVRDKMYKVDELYRRIENSFAKFKLQKYVEKDGTLCFKGTGLPTDYGYFGLLITGLREKAWFMDYVTKWIWYNSDDGIDENDYSVVDVLYHFTNKESIS